MKPTQLALKPSRLLSFLLALVSLVASVLLICLPFGFWWKVGLISIILLLSAYSIALSALLLLPWSCHYLTLNKDSEIELTQKNGKKFLIKVLPTSLVTPQLTVINLIANGHYLSRHILLLPDNVQADEARLWRIWLRLGLKNLDYSFATKPFR